MRSIVWTCLCLLCLLSMGEAQLAKFEPPEGKVYHGVGQQDKGVQEYIAAMGDSLHPLVNKIYFDVPGSRPGEYNKLRALLLANKVAGIFVELSIGFQDGNNSTDSLIAESTVYDATIDRQPELCNLKSASLFPNDSLLLVLRGRNEMRSTIKRKSSIELYWKGV